MLLSFMCMVSSVSPQDLKCHSFIYIYIEMLCEVSSESSIISAVHIPQNASKFQDKQVDAVKLLSQYVEVVQNWMEKELLT